MSNKFIEDDAAFKQYLEKYNGDKFAAVMDISKQARNLMKKYPNLLRDSQAISYVMSGNSPVIQVNEDNRRSNIDEILESVTSYVNDLDVLDCVKSSIHESLKHKHLIYDYKYVNDNFRMARIRILCNIAWDRILKS